MPVTLCPRCGQPRLGAAELYRLAVGATEALDSMRLAIPDTVKNNLRAMARGLGCHAGTCVPQQQGLELKGVAR